MVDDESSSTLPIHSPPAPPGDPDAQNVESQVTGNEDPTSAFLVQLAADMAALRLAVESRLTYDATKERAFERLYAELDTLKADKAFEAQRPLFHDMILLFDRLDACWLEAQATGLPQPFIDTLNTLRDEVLEILSRRDVEPIVPASASFDGTQQLAAGVQPVKSPEMDRVVVRVVRRGFRYRDRLIRPEEVIVGQYTLPANTAG